MNNDYKWPLQVSSFTFLDKLKISSFIFSGKRLTQGELVKEYEDKWANETRSRYAVMTSSGSTANILMAMWIKDKLQKNGKWDKGCREVIVPAVTWPTSINQFIMLGFKPVFIDIELNNLGLSHNQAGDYITDNYEKVALIFPTALIGMNPDFRLFDLARHFEIDIQLDNCEASFNFKEKRYYTHDEMGVKSVSHYNENICSLATSSTSTYIGHYANSIEGGMIFCNNEQEYRYYLMARNHGMVRSLVPYSHRLKTSCGLDHPNDNCWDWLYNRDVDPSFDFAILGNNFRSTDLNAKFGLLDSARWKDYKEHRLNIAKVWKKYFWRSIPADFIKYGNIPFSLPLEVEDSKNLNKLKNCLADNKIEYRPLVAGDLSRQTCYKELIGNQKFPNASRVHENMIYVGLPNDLKEEKIHGLAMQLQYLIK